VRFETLRAKGSAIFGKCLRNMVELVLCAAYFTRCWSRHNGALAHLIGDQRAMDAMRRSSHQ
jgi:hypothetical protein